MKSCPDCGQEFDDSITFCPECETIGVTVDNSKKKRKKQSILNKENYFNLKKNFEEVYAIKYKNVHNIELFQGDSEDRNANWIKQSSALVLKDGHAYLSVEMTSSDQTTPKEIAGNILLHAVAESVVVTIKGGLNEKTEYTLNEFPRYLLIILPDPSELKESRKEEQIPELENRIKRLGFMENTTLKNFKVSYVSDFDNSLQDLLKD